jgi:hypothetical protein
MTLTSRLVAIALLAIPFGRWLGDRQASKMAEYRALSHDALLAVLQEQNKNSTASSYVGAFIALAAVFFLVLGVSALLERLARHLRTG